VFALLHRVPQPPGVRRQQDARRCVQGEPLEEPHHGLDARPRVVSRGQQVWWNAQEQALEQQRGALKRPEAQRSWLPQGKRARRWI
jgi:hypothetical protein